jgi:hypothetical protein
VSFGWHPARGSGDFAQRHSWFSKRQSLG